MAKVEDKGTYVKDNSVLGLASLREKKGISLQQIANATKIGVRSLQAIENGEFKKLPGGIYSTSYIRQYAHAVDFDESEILALYHSTMGIVPLSETFNTPAESEGHGLLARLRQAAVATSI